MRPPNNGRAVSTPLPLGLPAQVFRDEDHGDAPDHGLALHPARFSLSRMEPLLGSNRAGFSAGLRSEARFSIFQFQKGFQCQLGHGAFASPLDPSTSYRRLNFHMR